MEQEERSSKILQKIFGSPKNTTCQKILGFYRNTALVIKNALLQKIKRLVKSSALGKTVALNNTGLPETANFLLYRFVQVRGCTAVQNSGTSDSTSTSGAGTVHCTWYTGTLQYLIQR